MRLLLLLLCCMAMPVRAGGEHWQRCLDTAKQRQPAAVDLAKDCPKLFRELQKQRLPASAEPPLAGTITLAQLQFLLRSRQAVRISGSIGQDGLDALLAEILQPEAPNPEAAWRQALMAWLDKLKSGDYETQYRWLLRFFRAVTPSGAVLQALLYAAIGLLVIMSLWLIVMEFYYAGAFVKFPSARRNPARRGMLPDRADRPCVAWQELDALPPVQQMAILLSEVIAGLAGSGMIPADATFTYRQLGRCLGERAPKAGEPFMRLLQGAEPILYGNRGVSEETLRACRRDAQMLLGTFWYEP